MKKHLLILTASLLVTVIQAQTVYEELRYIIDGDTAQFENMRCRFAYVDTPESGNNPKARKDSAKYNIPLDTIYQAGRMAKRYVKSKMRKGQVYRIDVKKKGRYGRNICEIYIDKKTTINDLVVRDGFAVPFWQYIPLSKKPHFVYLLYKAKKEDKGLWQLYPALMRKMAL